MLTVLFDMAVRTLPKYHAHQQHRESAARSVSTDMQAQREFRVIGVPRSGTNLVKYLLEQHTDIRCYFNLGWWKHALIPMLMTQTTTIADQTPTAVVFREPMLQLASLYNFASRGGGAISYAVDFETFLSSPMELHPDASIAHQFASPIEYWIQFYHAALSWQHPRKFFLELSDLQKSPGIVGGMVSLVWPKADSTSEFRLPDGYLHRNQDRHLSELTAVDKTKTVESQARASQTLLATLNETQIKHVLNPRARDIYARLLRAKTI